MRIKHEPFPLDQTPEYLDSFRPPIAKRRRRLLPLAITLLLAGCGGGGGGSNTGGNPPPPDTGSNPPPDTGGNPPPDTGGNPPPTPANQPPVATPGCSTTRQSNVLRGFLQATDRDNSSSQLTFSLDSSVPNVTGPFATAKGTVELLDLTTGEFAYTPNNLGPRGADTFQFRVDDPDSFATGIETVVIDPAIMPLGDSITDGAFGNEKPPIGERVGYRRQLYRDLAAMNFNIDFVGSLQGGQNADPPIGDPDHEGHDGYTSLQIAQNVHFWLTLNPADVVLLHVGTNNINFDNPVDTVADIQQILNGIDRWESENATPVIVFLAEIIERTTLDGLTCDGCNANVASLNAMIRAIPASRPDDDIVIVNQHDALDYSCDDGFCDMSPQQAGSLGNSVYIHPTQTGYNKMAATWLPQLLKSNKLSKCD